MAELPATSVFDRWLDPAGTAVVCIDMHRSHVGPDAELPSAAPRARQQIPTHNAFHRVARSLGIPVIHAQHVQRHGGIDESRPGDGGANWRVIRTLYRDPEPLLEQLGWDETRWVDLMVETAPGDHYVRTKKRLSAFYPTDLEFLLQQLGVGTVVLTGTLTHACIIATAFDAADRDFRVVVPRQVVAGTSEAAEHAALFLISLHLGLVVDIDDLVATWHERLGREPPSVPLAVVPVQA